MGNLLSKRKINETSDEVLKGAYTARVRKDREEPVWMNEVIRKEIKERKRLNRRRQAGTD